MWESESCFNDKLSLNSNKIFMQRQSSMNNKEPCWSNMIRILKDPGWGTFSSRIVAPRWALKLIYSWLHFANFFKQIPKNINTLLTAQKSNASEFSWAPQVCNHLSNCPQDVRYLQNFCTARSSVTLEGRNLFTLVLFFLSNKSLAG